jgi:hypothetical protein
MPSPEHGHLGWLPGGGLAVGPWRLRLIAPETMLRKAADSAQRSALSGAEPATLDELAALDEQASELDPTHRYFLAGDGAVNVMSPEGVAQHLDAGLPLADRGREISAEGAVSAWWATTRPTTA